MRREERVTVQGPVKKQQPDGMSHRGGGGAMLQTIPLLLRVQFIDRGGGGVQVETAKHAMQINAFALRSGHIRQTRPLAPIHPVRPFRRRRARDSTTR